MKPVCRSFRMSLAEAESRISWPRSCAWSPLRTKPLSRSSAVAAALAPSFSRNT
jgi:hypothetical protein